MIKLCMTGGRDYKDKQKIIDVLDRIHAEVGVALLIEGGGTGADAMARDWARYRNIPLKTYPANWTKLGRAAGPIRNGEMLHEAQPDLLVTFPGGRGTMNCTQQALDLGIKVVVAFTSSLARVGTMTDGKA